MDLRPFFQWMQDSGLATSMNQSVWLYAVVQAFHLVTLAIFLGAVLIVALRLLGFGFRQQPIREVAREAQPWMTIGFVGVVITGTLQLIAGAMKEYSSDIFWMKMYILVAAIIFTFTVRHIVARADQSRVGSVLPKIVGLVSIILWISVAVPARLIGLF